MEINDFKKFLEVKYTFCTGADKIKVTKYNILADMGKLQRYKITNIDGEGVIFTTTKDKLTIFEASLMYYIFHEKRKPIDYAGFHKCIAGKRFIESIKEVWNIYSVSHLEEEKIYGN